MQKSKNIMWSMSQSVTNWCYRNVALYTVKSLAPICSSLTSTMFSEPCFRQTHTARHRQIKRKYYLVRCQGTNWVLLKKWTSLHLYAVLGRQWSVVVRHIFMPGLSCFGDIPWFFFSFSGITGCGSASLKLCTCNAASPWSQSPCSNSQCPGKAGCPKYFRRGALDPNRRICQH